MYTVSDESFIYLRVPQGFIKIVKQIWSRVIENSLISMREQLALTRAVASTQCCVCSFLINRTYYGDHTTRQYENMPIQIYWKLGRWSWFVFRFSLFVFRFSLFVFRHSNLGGISNFNIQNPILTFALRPNIVFWHSETCFDIRIEAEYRAFVFHFSLFVFRFSFFDIQTEAEYRILTFAILFWHSN